MTSTAGNAYRPVRSPHTRRLSIRGLDYHLREWGSASGLAPLVMLHGGRDSSASFQFLVDALKDEHYIVAPDWRGHGRTEWAAGAYWHSDLLCDLDCLLSNIAPDTPVTIIGHSMGGNIAALLGSLRPSRVRKLVLLDSLGNTLDKSPVRIADELEDQLTTQATPPKARLFPDVTALAHRLMQTNSRLEWPKALFLAEIAATPGADTFVRWPHDPEFKRSRPTLRSVAEWGDVWSRIAAPVLCLLSSDPRPNGADGHPDHVRERVAFFKDIQVHRLPSTSHNLHVDAPERVAELIASFLRAEIHHQPMPSGQKQEPFREHS